MQGLDAIPTWDNFLLSCLACFLLVGGLLFLNRVLKTVSEANIELEAQWDQTLERLGTADCLKASDDMVVERCGAEAATSLLCSKYITTILLPVALCYATVVLIPLHLQQDLAPPVFADIPFRLLTIHETLMNDKDNATLVVWLHLGFLAVVAVAVMIVTMKLLGRFHEYFQCNPRWSRSTLARRSIRVDVEPGKPCEQVAAELLETLMKLSIEANIGWGMQAELCGGICANQAGPDIVVTDGVVVSDSFQDEVTTLLCMRVLDPLPF